MQSVPGLFAPVSIVLAAFLCGSLAAGNAVAAQSGTVRVSPLPSRPVFTKVLLRQPRREAWTQRISAIRAGMLPGRHANTEADTTKRSKAKNPTGAMVRSILFPGWGQLYNGKYFKAILVFGVEAGIIGYAIYMNQKAHESGISDFDREFYVDQRNVSYWRTGAVVLLSMLDAYVDAHLSDFDESPDLAIDIGAGPGEKGNQPLLSASLRLKF